MPKSGDFIYDKHSLGKCFVTGWGRRSEYGQISPVLREVHLPIISNNKCMQMYRLSGQNEVHLFHYSFSK